MNDTTTLVHQLEALHDELGDLTPELVVEAARDPQHPLHNRFEWNDTVAAEKYRLTQAAQLLRVTYRPDPSKPNDLRRFAAVKGEDSPRSVYTPIEKVLEDEFARRVLLQRMDREWKSFKRNYEHMAEFADLIGAAWKEIS